jgi:hypothetical protein
MKALCLRTNASCRLGVRINDVESLHKPRLRCEMVVLYCVKYVVTQIGISIAGTVASKVDLVIQRGVLWTKVVMAMFIGGAKMLTVPYGAKCCTGALLHVCWQDSAMLARQCYAGSGRWGVMVLVVPEKQR